MDLLLLPNSIASTIIIVSIVSCLYIIILFVRRDFGAKRKRYHPVGGTVLHQLLNFDRLQDYMTDLAMKHDTYRIITHNPFRAEVFTANPSNVEYILKTNFQNYGKGWYNYSILHDLLGDGIFTVDGEKWREQRKVSSQEFSTNAVKDISRTIFQRNAVKLANIVHEFAVTNEPIDIQDLFMKSALDSIFGVAFGVDLDNVCGSNMEGARFSRAFDDASAIIMRRYVDFFWKIKKFLNIGLERKLKECLQVVDEFVYKVIHNNMSRSQVDHDSMSKKEDILSRFLQLSEANPKYLRDIILNFVMAGKDTTATTLSWFFYMLCKHPRLQKKIVKEIREVTRTNSGESISEFAGSLNEEALEEMHYLHSALTETLRLYPPVPVDPKMCLSDDTLPDGFHVKRGDTVGYLPYAMGRMRSIWGDDAQDFKPERWLDAKGRFQQKSPFMFTAFQGGPRICLGKEFAYRQLKLLSTVLLRFFVFKMSSDKTTVKYRTMINLHIDGGLHVRAFCK